MTRSRVQLSLALLAALLCGCSREVEVAGPFRLPSKADLTLPVVLRVQYPSTGLYFTLEGVPASKTDRDYTDHVQVELRDDKGTVHRPDRIRDINGARRDIVADCSKIPKGTRLVSVRIIALKDIRGTGIRWWTGQKM